MGILPDSTTPPTALMSEDVWLFYGLYGVGKTTLAAQFPKPLFVAAEAGCKGINVAQKACHTREDFGAIIRALKTEDHGYRTVVVDTANALRAQFEIAVCKDNGVSDPGENRDDYGLVWRILGRQWESALKQLASLDMCVVLLAHEKRSAVTVQHGKKRRETGQMYVTTSLSDTARGVLHSHVDHIIRIAMRPDGSRFLLTEHQLGEGGADIIEAKSRGTLGGPCLPAELPATFEALSAAYTAAFKE